MEEIKAVVFDIDGTLSPNTNSWLAMTQGLGASVDEHKAIFFQGFKEGTISYEDSRKQLIALWHKTGNATRPYLENMFRFWPVFHEAQELISFLQDKGLKIAFITGSMGMYAKVIAEKLSVPEYYANCELVFDSNENLIDLSFPQDESQRKLEHLLAFCSKVSIAPHNVVVIGDGGNNLGMFTATEKGILVGSEKPEELKKVAWKAAENILEVKGLLTSLLQN